MKLAVDRSKCVSLGICEGIASNVFVLNDEGELEVDETAEISEVDLEAVYSAVSGCPVSALSLVGE